MLRSVVVWSGWKPEYLLPSPPTVFKALFDDFGSYLSAAAVTLQRALIGFAIAFGVVLVAVIPAFYLLYVLFGRPSQEVTQ